VRGKRLYRSGWTCALAALTVAAGAAHATSIYRLEERAGGVAGVAGVGPEFVARGAWVDDARANSDGVASPGEKVAVRISLQNVGVADAGDTRIALATDDPDVDISTDAPVYTVWPVGLAIELGWNVTIGTTAAAHDVSAIVTVTADNGGPWRFIVTFPVATAPLHFAKLDDRIEDPVPDGDADGVTEPGERVRVGVRFRNDGTTDAANVRAALQTLDPDVSPVVAEAIHASWPAGEERDTVFLLNIASEARSHSASASITVAVDGVDPWQYSVTSPIVGQDPDFAFRSFWLFDPAPGGNRDGIATPGERVLPRVRLRNVGTGDAVDVAVTLSTSDPDIAITQGRVTHATWPVGAARNNNGFVLDIATDATAHDAILVASVAAADGGTWQLTVPFTIGEPRFGIAHRRSWLFDPEPGGNRDGSASPGERVLPVMRLLNNGPSAARNVLVALEIDDPAVTVIRGTMYRARWEPGAAFTHNGFVIRVAPDAAPHNVTAIVRVTAGNGGPWEFPFVFPIVHRPVEFVQRSAWLFDPAPGGDGDGQAEAGERLFPRIRLRNVGVEDATNVTVRLMRQEGSVAVVAGEVHHESWPAGEARNNDGLILDISPEATPHEVEAVLSVFADDANPWQFSFTIPIVAGQVAATALLANYPNPFNPETWIPFDLSRAAEVTVTVYDARGMMVRRLDLGRLAPGEYRGRSSAAYWDGRNDIGEHVSSGAYIYELRAGVHREMRRMIVRK
jgi:hypothetical protein